MISRFSEWALITEYSENGYKMGDDTLKQGLPTRTQLSMENHMENGKVKYYIHQYGKYSTMFI